MEEEQLLEIGEKASLDNMVEALIQILALPSVPMAACEAVQSVVFVLAQVKVENEV